MIVGIRADASIELGTGHISRCSRIALHLKSLGYDVVFICREGNGDQIGALRNQGFVVQQLQLPATSQSINLPMHEQYDWASDLEATRAAISNSSVGSILIDHYALDRRYSSALRKEGHKIIVLDDLANRPHDCDLIIDQNITPQSDYMPLVSQDCTICTGLQFNTVLLNPSFLKMRHSCGQRTGVPKKILVFFGGADSKNLTSKTLQQLSATDFEVTAILGSSHPDANAILKTYRDKPKIRILQNVSVMPELIAQSDLAIGSGGVSAWERTFLGLPSILIDSADNQKKVSLALRDAGAARYLGNYTDVDFHSIGTELAAFTIQSNLLSAMSEAAFNLWNDEWLHKQEIGCAIQQCLNR